MDRINICKNCEYFSPKDHYGDSVCTLKVIWEDRKAATITNSDFKPPIIILNNINYIQCPYLLEHMMVDSQ